VSGAALAESCEQGDGAEFGVLVTEDCEVVEFVFLSTSGAIVDWKTITTWWADTPYRDSIESAMRQLRWPRTPAESHYPACQDTRRRRRHRTMIRS
jgi:hypothetical protein